MEYSEGVLRLSLFFMSVLANECYGCWEQERVALLGLKPSINHPYMALPCHHGRRTSIAVNEPANYFFIVGLAGFEKLSRLSNLQILDLTDNYFNNSILTSLNGFSTLKTLFGWFEQLERAEYNRDNIDNIISNQGLCELRSTLQHLDLSYNKLEGNLPGCLAKLTSLRFLDLYSNQFTGNIAFSPLIQMTFLEHLVLSNNRFQVPITFPSFFNHSKLKLIESQENELVSELNFQTPAPRFQLAVIRLSHSASSNTSSTTDFPNFLYYQKDLQIVEISQISFDGKFPNWLLENNRGLVGLFLPNNSFRRYPQLPSHPETQLLALDISHNNFQHIPRNIGTTFPGLIWLTMSGNRFGGSIPSSLGDMSSLQILDLSNNQLSGGIPEHLAMETKGFSYALDIFAETKHRSYQGEFGREAEVKFTNKGTSLSYKGINLDLFSAIDLSCNRLTGHIPNEIGNIGEIRALNLSHNGLSGTIPTTFSNLYKVESLDISFNNLSGKLPSQLNELYSRPYLMYHTITCPTPYHKVKDMFNLINLIIVATLAIHFFVDHHFQDLAPPLGHLQQPQQS
ncbi:receptor-like protein 15 [Cornus florida]|uniref:receptor-like protein 15 n=1 Tax=Cornus florida TaxID=4283 RepID=UPI002897367F|nr:receptor-like protein 15 [Cornus florida]